jgi:hypothetical protein
MKHQPYLTRNQYFGNLNTNPVEIVISTSHMANIYPPEDLKCLRLEKKKPVHESLMSGFSIDKVGASALL